MTPRTKLPEPGELVIVDFPGVTGTKRRPAVILSSATYHSQRPDMILGVITSQVASANASTDYLLQDWQAAGLRKPSAFRAFIVTLPRSAVTAYLGQLSNSDWRAVRERIQIALG